MLNTVLFDMGGTLEDIWNNEETLAAVMEQLQAMLREAGLEPGCGLEDFQRKVLAGLKAYKSWSESVWLEKKPEEIWPDFYLREFGCDREKLLPITEEQRGYKLGVISNNASLYNVFNVLEDYGIRHFMRDVTVSSVTGYRKPHPEIFRISLRQMQVKAENCVYVGDTISRDIIGSKRAGFGKAVQIGSHLSAQKDAEVGNAAERPDMVITDIRELTAWLDEINPAMAPN